MKNVLRVKLVMGKRVPNVISVHIHQMALLLAHCVQQVNRNPTQDNRVVLIVWLGRLAMGKHVPNVMSVRLLQKNPLLAQHVHRADSKICEANQIVTIAKLGNLLLPQVPPPAWIVCPLRNQTLVQQIARLVKWAECNVPTIVNFAFYVKLIHTVWFPAVKSMAPNLKIKSKELKLHSVKNAKKVPVVKTGVSSRPKTGGGAPTPTIRSTNAKHPRLAWVLPTTSSPGMFSSI